MLLLATVLGLLSMTTIGESGDDFKYLQPWIKMPERHVTLKKAAGYKQELYSTLCAKGYPNLAEFKANSEAEMQEIYTWLRVLRIYDSQEVIARPVYLATSDVSKPRCNNTANQCCNLNVTLLSTNYSTSESLTQTSCHSEATILCELPDSWINVTMSVNEANNQIDLETHGVPTSTAPFKVRLFVDNKPVKQLTSRASDNDSTNRYTATIGRAGSLCGRWVRGEVESSVGYRTVTPGNGTRVTAGCIAIGDSSAGVGTDGVGARVV